MYSSPIQLADPGSRRSADAAEWRGVRPWFQGGFKGGSEGGFKPNPKPFRVSEGGGLNQTRNAFGFQPEGV